MSHSLDLLHLGMFIVDILKSLPDDSAGRQVVTRWVEGQPITMIGPGSFPDMAETYSTVQGLQAKGLPPEFIRSVLLSDARTAAATRMTEHQVETHVAELQRLLDVILGRAEHND